MFLSRNVKEPDNGGMDNVFEPGHQRAWQSGDEHRVLSRDIKEPDKGEMDSVF